MCEVLGFHSLQSIVRQFREERLNSSAKNSALASKPLACTKSLPLHLCSLKKALDACSKPATLVSRETREPPGRSLAMFCGTDMVVKSESEPEPELGRTFFAAAVTSKWLATSSLSFSLYESSWVRRPAGRR